MNNENIVKRNQRDNLTGSIRSLLHSHVELREDLLIAANKAVDSGSKEAIQDVWTEIILIQTAKALNSYGLEMLRKLRDSEPELFNIETVMGFTPFATAKRPVPANGDRVLKVVAIVLKK